MPISDLKASRLNALSTPEGIIAALAMDQRKSLRRMIADAAGRPLESITDAQLVEFKTAVTEELTPGVSAVLLDPEYGLEAAGARANGCGLLLAYESDGYENPRPNRMLELMPHLTVRRLRDAGADGIKILLSYTPFDDPAANERKCALIERIGAECEALDMPFFLEPVGYDPDGTPPLSIDYARLRPEIVLRSMEEFSRDIYKVDVLKVEFPVDARFVEGSSVFSGQAAYTMADALGFYREADGIARRPYVYLSAGVSGAQFLESLRMAGEAGSQFSGVLCGRATWSEGISEYARNGSEGLKRWLGTSGGEYVRQIRECLNAAVPWDSRTRMSVG